MSETCTDETLSSIRAARALLDQVFSQVLVSKALKLHTRAGFDRAVAALSRRLLSSTHEDELKALKAAVDTLDVDWHSSSAAQRRQLIRQSMSAAGRHTAAIPSRIKTHLGEAANEVIAATRAHGRAQGLAIGVDFNAMDRRVAQHLVKSNLNFVTDEYGRRLQGLSTEAQGLVAEGVEQGLGQKEIAASLRKLAEGFIVGRSAAYWDVVAASFIANGRSFAQLSSYAEAKIEHYQIEAVLDERTTETCRFLHGKTFSVSAGLERFEHLETIENPDALKAARPWVREGIDSIPMLSSLPIPPKVRRVERVELGLQ